MFYFFNIEKNLWQIYCEVRSPTGRADIDVLSDFSVILAQAVLCRCEASMKAVDLYGRLVALHRPALTAVLTLSEQERAEVALGRSGPTLADQLEQIRQDVGNDPIRERAYHEILSFFAKLIGDADMIERHRLPGPELAESRLALDPSRPEIWVEASLGHRRRGSLQRSLQLMRRAASSGYPQAAQAGEILSDWVASVWGKSVVTAETGKV